MPYFQQLLREVPAVSQAIQVGDKFLAAHALPNVLWPLREVRQQAHTPHPYRIPPPTTIGHSGTFSISPDLPPPEPFHDPIPGLWPQAPLCPHLSVQVCVEEHDGTGQSVNGICPRRRRVERKLLRTRTPAFPLPRLCQVTANAFGSPWLPKHTPMSWCPVSA